MKIEVKINHNEQRGELNLFVNDEYSGEMTFIFKEKNVISVNHTGVHPELKGKGYGKYLMEELVKFVRENSLKIIPVCPYVTKVIERTPEFQDLLYKK
ncbi:MAG: GNAT family N-acetyltransferase [Paludibacteraceae bacterium]